MTTKTVLLSVDAGDHNGKEHLKKKNSALSKEYTIAIMLI